jgi:hypothetical protein
VLNLLGLKSLSLGSVNLALVSLYFFPLWGRGALRALVSPYNGLEDRAQAAAAIYLRQLFDLGSSSLVTIAHVLAGIRLVVAMAFACYLIEFARSLAVRREVDRDTTDVVLILAVIGVALSALSALALGDAAAMRLAATQTLMVAGAITIVAVERHLASGESEASRAATAMRERETARALAAAAVERPSAQARLRHVLMRS